MPPASWPIRFHLLRLSQLLLDLAPLAGFQGQRHQVGHGHGERLLVFRPLSRAAHVFVAQDARAFTADGGRDVEHGRDAEGPQVVVGELTRVGVGQRIVGCDDVGLHKRAEVVRMRER